MIGKARFEARSDVESEVESEIESEFEELSFKDGEMSISLLNQYLASLIN